MRTSISPVVATCAHSRRSIHSVIRRPFPWPKAALSVEDVVAPNGTPISTTSHTWMFRKIEAEITLGLYHPSVALEERGPTGSFEIWHRDISRQLDKWYEAVGGNGDLSEKIEFYETFYWNQVFRLNRPSPACPRPSIEMRRKSTRSALRLMHEVSTTQRRGKLFYIFHNAHYLVDTGLSLLESIATGIQHVEQELTHLDKADVPALVGTVRSIPVSLRQMARRWPTLYSSANAVEQRSLELIKGLERWGLDGPHLTLTMFLWRRSNTIYLASIWRL